jgi:hypothetical protein
MMVVFNPYYLLLTTGLLLLEIGIGAFVHDHLIRPYAGDVLATIFLYCLVRSFVTGPNGWIILSVLLASYLIEAAQYVQLLTQLNLTQYWLARLLLGTAFEWSDMLAYTLGALIVFLAEQLRARLQP